jgi:DNA-directed RNA polymerase specialized sigma24 family protein
MQAISEKELIIYQLVTKTELSYRELADILEMSQTGVMKAYQRASKKMETQSGRTAKAKN